MNYVYHDNKNHMDCTPIIEDRESRWLELMQRFENSNGICAWTEEEIKLVIEDIQEYVLLDYPEERGHTIRQLRDALDGVARVTLMLFRAYAGHDKVFDTPYATKKLYSVLRDLQPA